LTVYWSVPAHRAAAPGGHRWPVRRLGDPHPRGQPAL